MNDTQAQARPVRPTLEEVEAYVHGKGYDVPGAANAVSVNIIFTIYANAFSPIAPTRIRRIRQRGCAAFGV